MSEPAIFVGHRGFPQRYPENSLIGIKAALELGAEAIEIDVQASADGEPVVCHDTNLKRVAGRSVDVSQTSAAELQQVSIHEPKRFGSLFEPCLLAHLQQVVELMTHYPAATLFVELKKEIFARYQRLDFVARVMPLLSPLRGRVVLISFDLDCLRIAQNQFSAQVGWVISHYTHRTHRLLQQQAVNVVIADWHKLPSAQPLWQGPWQWFIYDITDVQAADEWQQRGVRFIESWNIEALLNPSGDPL